MSWWLALVIVLPVGGSVLTSFARGRPGPVVPLGIAAATTAATVGLTAAYFTGGTPGGARLAGPAALELTVLADGLAVAMLLMTSVTALAVTAFGAVEDRRAPRDRHPGHWPLWFGLWAALHLLFLAADLLTAYLMFEAVGTAAAVLVVLGGERRRFLAGTRYLYAELASSVTALLGIALIWREVGDLAYSAIGPALTDAPAGWWAIGLLTTGLLMKVPLVPLHLWLPSAHSLAPSAVSPMLSGVVVKTAFVVLVRLWFGGDGEVLTPSAAQLLGGLGVVAIVWGSLAALRADGVKELIAYSTLAQLGLLFLLPPLVEAGASNAWTGGLFHAVAHAPAKAALLLAASVLVADAGRSSVEGLIGTAARRPMATLAIGIAAVSLVGLPPSAGFVGKWFLLLASIEVGQWWWVLPNAGGSLLTVAYLMRLIRPAFAPPPARVGPPPARVGPPPGTSGDSTTPVDTAEASPITSARDLRDGIALALAATTLALGLSPAGLLGLLEAAAPLGTVTVGPVGTLAATASWLQGLLEITPVPGLLETTTAPGWLA